MNDKAERQAWVETWAQRIEAGGGSSMALFLIEFARPFAFLCSQALLMAQPLLAGTVDDTTIERAMALLNDPELLSQLGAHLEGGRTE